MISKSLTTKIEQLREEVLKAVDTLEIDQKQRQVQTLTYSSQQPNFWDDTEKAQRTMKKISNIERSINPWLDLRNKINELTELINLADNTMEEEISAHLAQYQKTYTSLKKDLLFSGSYDDHDAILALYAGAGEQTHKIGLKCYSVCIRVGRKCMT